MICIHHTTHTKHSYTDAHSDTITVILIYLHNLYILYIIGIQGGFSAILWASGISQKNALQFGEGKKSYCKMHLC